MRTYRKKYVVELFIIGGYDPALHGRNMMGKESGECASDAKRSKLSSVPFTAKRFAVVFQQSDVAVADDSPYGIKVICVPEQVDRENGPGSRRNRRRKSIFNEVFTLLAARSACLAMNTPDCGAFTLRSTAIARSRRRAPSGRSAITLCWSYSHDFTRRKVAASRDSTVNALDVTIPKQQKSEKPQIAWRSVLAIPRLRYGSPTTNCTTKAAHPREVLQTR